MTQENLNKIVSKIRKDAQAEASKIIEKARKQAEEIRREAEREAEKKYSEMISSYQREAEQEKQRIVANAKLKARKIVLDAREEVISEAFSEAVERLKNLPRDKYREVLLNLIKEGVEAIQGDAEVLLRKEDSRLITSTMLKELSSELGFQIKKSKERISAIGGVVVRSSDGRIEVDNTFETRLERQKDELRKEVAKVLFQ